VSAVQINVMRDQRRLKQPFVIARGAMETTELVVVELTDGDHTGRGEAAPNARFGQSVDSAVQQLEDVRPHVEKGISREELLDLLPPCSARNALDCALWDLQAKKSGRTVWQIAGLDEPTGPLTGDVTVSLGAPEWMAREAKRFSAFDLIKVKLNRHNVRARMEAVKRGAPDSRFIVDVNEDWTLEGLKKYAPMLKDLGVEMIEQPLKRGEDQRLLEYNAPIPLGADESCCDRADLDYMQGRYDFINIKLDKTGGLTEALHLAREAKTRGFGLMTGCMVSTSLSMAPGFVVASLCTYRDLDGASMLKQDRTPSLRLEDGLIYPFSTKLWGG